MEKTQAQAFNIRAAKPEEFTAVGALMVDVYSSLPGFPNQLQQPAYYEMLARIGDLTKNPGTELLVALSPQGELLGGVVYFSDMKYYSSGGSAITEKNAAGFRLLAVSSRARGIGVGRGLTLACIQKARDQKQKQLIIHTTRAMKVAWVMYERLGFARSPDLDFKQQALPIFGFRLKL